jgi:glycosyltransferase involved in cell wall biosynthesis
MKKVLFLTNVISHYQIPLFNEVNRRYREIVVVSTRPIPIFRKKLGWQSYDQLIEFRYDILNERKFKIFGKQILYSEGSIRLALSTDSKIVVIGGYATLTSWLFLLIAKLRGLRIVMRNGTHRYSQLSDSKIANTLKRIFLSKCDAFIAYGSMSREYLLSFGVNEDLIEVEYNTVDTQNMISMYQSLKTIDRYIEEKYKKELHFPSKSILFVGQIIERKNILTILKAMKLIDSLDLDIGLRLVGDGDQRSELEKYVERCKLKNVQFLGSVPPDEMYKYYIASDAVCLLSMQEPWGLVINEAMCFGNAILVSKECGCSCDLVRENGVIIDGATDYHKVSESIINIFSSFEKLERMKNKSMSVARQYDINNAVSAYERAIFNMPSKK